MDFDNRRASILPRLAGLAACPTAKKERKMRTKTKIRTLFLAKPKGTKYPGEETICPRHYGRPTLDSRAEYYSEKLSMLENENLEFVGKNLIRTEADLEGMAEEAPSEAGVLAFILTTPTRGLKEVVSFQAPTIISNDTPGGACDCGFLGALLSYGNEKNLISVSSSDFGDVQRKIKVLDAIHRLKETKILCVTNGGGGGDFAERAKEKLGVEVKYLGHETLLHAYDVADETEAEKLAKEWIENAEKVVEPTKDDVVKAARMYFGIRNLMEEEGANAIAINCFGLCVGAGLPMKSGSLFSFCATKQ